MRLDVTYYYWPSAWIKNRPGFMTGSGIPMRFADTNGAATNVYQSATVMTDESGQSYPSTVNTLLDNALGAQGYYGAFTANFHTDSDTTVENDRAMASAAARNVPIVSARQMLTWLDGRNASTFTKRRLQRRHAELRRDGGNGRDRADRHAPDGVRGRPAVLAHAQRQPGDLHHPDDQGARVRVLHGRLGHLHRALRDGGRRQPGDHGAQRRDHGGGHAGVTLGHQSTGDDGDQLEQGHRRARPEARHRRSRPQAPARASAARGRRHVPLPGALA